MNLGASSAMVVAPVRYFALNDVRSRAGGLQGCRRGTANAVSFGGLGSAEVFKRLILTLVLAIAGLHPSATSARDWDYLWLSYSAQETNIIGLDYEVEVYRH